MRGALRSLRVPPRRRHLQLSLAEVGGHPSVVSLQQGARASRLLRRALLADEFLATLRGGAANRLALVRGDEIDVVVVEERGARRGASTRGRGRGAETLRLGLHRRHLRPLSLRVLLGHLLDGEEVVPRVVHGLLTGAPRRLAIAHHGIEHVAHLGGVLVHRERGAARARDGSGDATADHGSVQGGDVVLRDDGGEGEGVSEVKGAEAARSQRQRVEDARRMRETRGTPPRGKDERTRT